jgi:hypothetical protein
MDLKGIGRENMDWFLLAQFDNPMMDLLHNESNFVTS